jgi:hypothetical protein
MEYETGWSPIVPFQLGSVVSSKFDAAFSKIDLAFDDIETHIELYEIRWSDNTDAWDIQSDVNNNFENRITALESRAFTFTSNDGMTVSNEAYDDSVAVTHTFSTSDRGVVMYGYSITFSGTVSDKLYIEMTVPNADGTDGTPFEHVLEVKDSAEVRPDTYFFPIAHTVALTDATARLRFKKGSGDADFTVNYIDIMTEIKN